MMIDSNRYSDLMEFQKILKDQNISCVYQPIVSLDDGSVFGYEALTRGPLNSVFRSPVRLFEFAEREGSLYVLDKLAREKAIAGCRNLARHQKVFINIPAHIIHDSRFTPGNTLKVLEANRLTPQNVIFEITERSSIEDFSTTKKILQHYRSQGYQIAIDDAGAGYSSLQAIAELQPDFIKIDRSLVSDVHSDRIKENILETFVTFAQKMNIRLIAEGIEKAEELDKLIRMGIHFGQGYYLGAPHPQFQEPSGELAVHIREIRNIHLPFGFTRTIGELVQPVEVYDASTAVSEVATYFKSRLKEQGTVIVSGNIPVGMVMREKLFQQLAEKYGVPLYWTKPITNLMDSRPLIVDEHTPVELVSQMAMAREIDKLYDLVIVTRQGKLLGTVSVRAMLECIAIEKMERAKFANPLR